MSALFIGYLVGAVLMLVLCGVAIGDKITYSKLVGACVVAAIWPLVFPLMIGAMIREFAR